MLAKLAGYIAGGLLAGVRETQRGGAGWLVRWLWPRGLCPACLWLAG